MQKLYENFHIFYFQKRIVSVETIRGNTVYKEMWYKYLTLNPEVEVRMLHQKLSQPILQELGVKTCAYLFIVKTRCCK